MRLGGPQGWSGRVHKISSLLGFNPWSVQPIVSHCSDYFIPRHIIKQVLLCTKHYSGYQIEKNNMGGACNMYGGDETFIQGFGRET
jgi:hypothetical protein